MRRNSGDQSYRRSLHEGVKGMVTAKAALSAHCSSALVFYPKAEHFSIEELHLHGPNVIRFMLVIGRRRWHIMGCYISSRDASTIEDAIAAIRNRSFGGDILVAVNLNANLEDLEGTPQSEAISDEPTAACMMDFNE